MASIPRLSLLVCASALTLALAGCGGAPAAQPADPAAASQTADATAATLPDDVNQDQYADTGQGTAYLVSTEGTTEDGDVLKLGVNPSNRSAEVSVVTQGLADASPLYIYVDGTRVAEEDKPDGTVSLTLEGDQLADGEHSMEFVQFQGGDPSAAVTFYRVARYAVG